MGGEIFDHHSSTFLQNDQLLTFNSICHSAPGLLTHMLITVAGLLGPLLSPPVANGPVRANVAQAVQTGQLILSILLCHCPQIFCIF